MGEFIKKNGWAIAIALISVGGTYAVMGYRVDALERQVNQMTINVETIRASQEQNNLQIQVALGKIQTDLEYLKAQFARR